MPHVIRSVTYTTRFKNSDNEIIITKRKICLAVGNYPMRNDLS